MCYVCIKTVRKKRNSARKRVYVEPYPSVLSPLVTPTLDPYLFRFNPTSTDIWDSITSDVSLYTDPDTIRSTGEAIVASTY